MKNPDPIDLAIREDLGSGDVTTDAVVPPQANAIGQIVAREKAILAGTNVAAEVFRRVEPGLQIEIGRRDGNEVNAGDVVIEIRGSARPILRAERVALNFLQRLSGIATLTRTFVDAADNPKVKILDTRKTTPALRKFEKAAVVSGGGANHRFGLFDMVLVKDNHLAIASGSAGLAAALRKIREKHRTMRIEVEADCLDQVRAFLEIPEIDIILLDNMKPTQIREAVALGRAAHGRRRKVEFEASGGITMRNIRQIAATGIDYISIGALTHSPRSVDFSLELTPVNG